MYNSFHIILFLQWILFQILQIIFYFSKFQKTYILKTTVYMLYVFSSTHIQNKYIHTFDKWNFTIPVFSSMYVLIMCES
jgi:hypothetical protein